MTEIRLLLCSCPSEAAETLARQLVEERLAACVNLLPQIVSVFRWQERTERADEALLLIKTAPSRSKALRDRICELHPYELPEILAVPVTDGLTAYLDWVNAQTTTH